MSVALGRRALLACGASLLGAGRWVDGMAAGVAVEGGTLEPAANGFTASVPAMPTAAGARPPSLKLARDWRSGDSPAGFWVSEKLDGVRGYWDGSALWTRGGLRVAAPGWFTAGWPAQPLDGELWMGRGRFEAAQSTIAAGRSDDPAWRQLRFMVFDLPTHEGVFEQRQEALSALVAAAHVMWLVRVEQFRDADEAALSRRLRRVVDAGGEGLMLVRAGSRYVADRNGDLRKFKLHDDAEARVVGHVPGQGRLAGLTGALIVELAGGRRMRLGSGLTDADRRDPPPIGSVVTYRYRGSNRNGLPRFATFLRRRVL